MKKLIPLVLSVLLSGCFCADLHSPVFKTPAGIYSGTRASIDVLTLPFKNYQGTSAEWCRARTIEQYPLFLIDLPFEIVADTITFPYDLTVKLMED